MKKTGMLILLALTVLNGAMYAQNKIKHCDCIESLSGGLALVRLEGEYGLNKTEKEVISGQSFLSQQKNYKRVKTAITEKEGSIKDNLQKHGLTPDSVHILMVAYKAEKQLEIYAKKKTESFYKQISVYNICSSSGKLGPKRREGDMQVPEGFYRIDRFNPASSFFLSLGIDYPNGSDRKKSTAKRLGGDIFIHGACVTIGCLPMTDNKIKEIYLYAVYARNNGQTHIPVYIFPFRMTDINFESYRKQYDTNPDLVDFWANLKTGYDKFISDGKALSVQINEKGDYQF